MNRLAGHTVKFGFEEQFGALDTGFTGDSDNTLVGEGVLHIFFGGLSGVSNFLSPVLCNVRTFFLNIFDNFQLGGGGEVVAEALADLLHPVGQAATGNLHLFNGVGDAVTFVDGNGVGDTITSVANKTGGSTSSVEGHDGLEGDIGSLNIELFEHDRDHLLTVLLGVTGSLSEENTNAFRGIATELVGEGVGPNLLHVFPRFNNTGFDGVLQVKDTSLLLSFVTDEFRFAGRSLHGLVVLWSTDDGGEDSAGSFFTSKAGLNHTGTIIDNDSLCVVSHLSCF